MGMREGSDPLALSRGTGIRGSCFFRFFARTRRRGSERVSTLSRSPMGTAIRGSLLLLFLPTNSPPGEREGSDPLALSRGAAIRGSYFFCFFEQTHRRRCKRVPTLSRSPVGLRFAAPTSFVSSNRLAAGGCERVPTLSRSPVGAAIRGFLLLSRRRSFPLILPA